jgi:hypothetical protein
LKEHRLNNATPAPREKLERLGSSLSRCSTAKNQLVEMIQGVQELYVGSDEFIVGVSCEMDGTTVRAPVVRATPTKDA